MGNICFNEFCRNKKCPEYIKWDFEMGDDEYSCESCKLVGQSYNIDEYPQDCLFINEIKEYEKEKLNNYDNRRNREIMEQESFKIKDMIAEKRAMESTIKDMLELFVIKYDVKEISVDGTVFDPSVKQSSTNSFIQTMDTTYLNIEVKY